MKILLLHIPALHLGYVGCYGNDWVSTPALDWLAARSVAFDQHYADSLGRWPTTWTGIYRFPWLWKKQQPAPPGLDELLQANGIPVIRITEAQLSAAGHKNPASFHDEVRQELQAALHGLGGQPRWLISLEMPSLLPPWLVGEHYLLHYFQPLDDEGVPQPAEAEEEESEEEEFLEEAEMDTANEDLPEEEDEDEDLEDLAEEAGILWPLLDPLPGLIDVKDARLLERLQMSYAAAVSQADDYLATALEQFRDAGLLDDLLLIVTAERGLALGEHGLVGDAKPWLHDELIHLPLLIRLPQADQAGRRVPVLTQPVDLFPTILEAFGLAAPPHHGHSLFPLTQGKTAGVREYLCAGLKIGDAVEWVLRTPEWALLLPEDDTSPRGPQLYAKPEDRWEVNGVRQQNMDLAEQLEQTLRGWIKATVQPEPFQPPTLHKDES